MMMEFDSLQVFSVITSKDEEDPNIFHLGIQNVSG